MRLFGPLHLGLLALTAVTAVVVSQACRRRPAWRRTVRLAIGCGLVVNELIWWRFRYAHEGLHWWNLPFQLCDVTLWMSALGCLTLAAPVVEFAYFAGLAGAGMALLTPDLWSPWPTYPAIYFFVAHGGIVIAVCVLVFGGISPLRAGAVWRAFGILLGFAAVVGAINALAGTNFMYLSRKPKNASLLDSVGPVAVVSGGGRCDGVRSILVVVAAGAEASGCATRNDHRGYGMSRRLQAASLPRRGRIRLHSASLRTRAAVHSCELDSTRPEASTSATGHFSPIQ